MPGQPIAISYYYATIPMYPLRCSSLLFLRYGRKIGDSVELQETQGIAYGVARVVIGWSQVSLTEQNGVGFARLESLAKASPSLLS